VNVNDVIKLKELGQTKRSLVVRQLKKEAAILTYNIENE
jgi:hypothetical protein